jgi:hypothetical protein
VLLRRSQPAVYFMGLLVSSYSGFSVSYQELFVSVTLRPLPSKLFGAPCQRYSSTPGTLSECYP